MKSHILIIEDNDQNYYLINYLLTSNGYITSHAKTGNDGIQKIIDLKPDLVLLDIQLPDIDGFQVVKKIKEIEEINNIPIVAVTSYAMVGDRETILSSGANGYIEKPINPDNFVEVVQSFI